ncbi:MAG: nitroreductase family protein [Desulfobulbus sp.]|jgi:nitroreductase|uniref:nitroreductase family protein n=1 Tax=Desulfobulbus sp. TaxID=895 RepID=UPI00283ACE7F|nr:nitroreductase family protein [Desulfobulbus sp.]MDR2549507.1 nitroreductase family protein [Desulfobulbus sp.]
MLIDLLRTRRSIRKFTAQPIEPETIDLLLEAALRSPSSKGTNPWELIVVTAPETMQQLAQSKAHGATFLKDAPLAIVVCADPAKSDVWVEDASIVATLLHLEAADLGLGSCWVQIRLRQRGDGSDSQAFLADLLGVPGGLKVLAIVGIGHPADTKSGHPLASLPFGQVSYERFGRRK